MDNYIYHVERSDLNKDTNHLYVNNDTVEIYKRDINSFFKRYTTKTIPISTITSVQIQEPSKFLAGYIEFSFPGSVDAGGSPAARENTFFFENKQLEDIKKIKSFVDEKIASAHSSSTQQLSAADEIQKFKELLDNGIISQEEFDAKKKQLLNL